MRFFRKPKQNDEWRTWFAWHPVPFIDEQGGWGWLEWVDRKPGICLGWIYRPDDTCPHPGL